MKKLFIIHGWTYSLDKWVDVCDALKKNGVEVVQLKVPGLTEKSSEVWDIDGYVEWLNNALKGVDKPNVLGHSNGGRIALAYVNKYPTRLRQLILVDSAGVPHNQLIPRAKLKTLHYVSKAGKVLARNQSVKKVFYKVIGAQDYNNAPPNMKLTMRNMLAADQKINFKSVKLPTTIIWGKQDSITPLKDGQFIHDSIKNSKMFVIDDARHAPFFNHPDRVADIITNSLGLEA